MNVEAIEETRNEVARVWLCASSGGNKKNGDRMRHGNMDVYQLRRWCE